MSATNRGERGGEGTDFFPTKPEAVRALLRARALPGGRWLEPCAGLGDIIRAVNAQRSDVTWTAVEVRPDFAYPLGQAMGGWESGGKDRVHTADFFAWDPKGQERFDVVIGNPPFDQSDRFIGACLERAPVVAFLEKLNYLGGQKRSAFWQRTYADIYVLSERPFPDMTEYAWYVWTAESRARGYGHYRVLGGDGAQLSLVP